MASDADNSTQARLDRLAHLSADERRDLAKDLSDEFDKADDRKDTDAMRVAYNGLELMDQFEKVLEQMSEVEAAKAEEVPTEAEKPSEEPAEEDAPKESEKPAEGDEETGDEAEKAPAEDGAKDAEVTESVAEEATAATEESEVLAMAASAVERPEDLKPATNSPAALTASVFAGVDVRGYAPGEKFRSEEDVAKAMSERIQTLGSGTGDGTRSLVASFRVDIPEDRQLQDSDAIQNQKKIDAVRGEKALIASGGFCAPLPVNYDIFGVGSTIRPVRDSLPSFGATRGGIRFIQPPVLGSYTAALSVWTAANDANPTSPTTKPRLKVTCASELTATTDAITLSLEFGNLMTRAFPELVQRHNQLSLVEHARLAEKTLLSKISALSNKVTTAHVYGTGRDILIHISEAIAAYRNRHRIPRPVQLRAIFPEWVRDAIREDISTNFAMGAQDINIGDAAVDAWFSARGVRVTWHMDDTFAAQTLPGALNGFPATIKYWLFAEGTLLFLDGGTLDLGVVRDADLVGTNDYITFVETFEGVAKVGIEVLEVTATTQLGLPVTP